MKNLYTCILQEGKKMDQKKEKHVITKYARTQTSLSKWWNNEKESYGDHLLLFLMSIKGIGDKVLLVIAAQYSWIATSFYDSAGKYHLDVNHVFCLHFVMSFHYTLH